MRCAAANLARSIAEAGPGPRAVTNDDEECVTIAGGPLVEAAETTRRAPLTVMRAR
ncbi:hypothetical protein [Streptomyces sp. CS113]|uniref:hypothetical protein n=1 Tax=Streptomyces sp. CS113 TaxID=1982761 RepID=UPI0015C61DA0|nr:hypothetical protein [Streptomyces sp. CS113]